MKKLNKSGEIYNKFIKGEPLSDEEVQFGEAFFSRISDEMSGLGDEFCLVARELKRAHAGLRSYRSERNLPALAIGGQEMSEAKHGKQKPS